MRSIYFLLLLLLVFFTCADAEQLSLELPLADEAVVALRIKQAFPHSFLLESLTFESDAPLEEAEFKYLVDLPEGGIITAEQVQRAVSYLAKKNKFVTIELVVQQKAEGTRLHWKLRGLWTFERLNVSGLLLGKDAYRFLYMLEEGEPFEQAKHAASLQKIKEAFRQNGYFNGKVTDHLVKHTESKSITANLALDCGERFVVSDIKVHWLETEHLPIELMVHIQQRVKKHFINRLISKYYQQKLINKEAKELRRLLGYEGFLDIGIELEKHINHRRQQVQLVFHINLHKKKQMVFVGNTFFSSAHLIDAIMVFGRSASLVPASILSQELCHLYHTKGFWEVSMKAEEDAQRFVFTIDEGARSCIDQVVVKGTDNFTPAIALEDFFKGARKNIFYDEALIKKATARLVEFYRKHGFLAAKVLKRHYVPTVIAHHYVLELSIDLGAQTYFIGVAIEQFPHLLAQGPFTQFNQDNVRVPFDPALLVDQKKFLQRALVKEGYGTAIVTYELIKEGDNEVRLVWKIDTTANAVTFGKTVVVGSSRLPFEYIKRELQYEEGEAWDKEKLKQSLLRLRALDLFEHIHLYPYQPAVVESQKAVLLKVREDEPFEMSLRSGLGLQQVGKHYIFGRGVTFALGLGLIGKSPLNIGDQVRFDLDFTRAFRKVNGCYLIPWTFGLPIRTLFKCYSNKYYQPSFLESIRNLYDVTQEGLLVSFARKYKVYDAALSLGVEWMKTDLKNAEAELFFIASQLATAMSFTPHLADKKIPYFQFEPTLFIDHLDDRLNPTYGSLTLFSFKGMIPLEQKFSDAYFFKLLVEQSFFFSFASNCVGAFRLRLGHIFSPIFNNVMPLERFYLGGAHSIRSYDVDLCPPVGTFNDVAGVQQIVPQGGQTMVNANFEVRFPLFKDLGAVVFQDIGTLVGGAHQQSVDDQHLLAGTGFGLRYNTPIGPLRFDIAFKWKRRDASESSYAWFLSLGHAF